MRVSSEALHNLMLQKIHEPGQEIPEIFTALHLLMKEDIRNPNGHMSDSVFHCSDYYT
jgi:histidinol phosphatase-like enzyme